MGFSLDQDDFDAEVRGLRAAGVEFDTFELEGITWKDGVAHIGVSRVV